MKVAIINGPNLNLLGKREESIYGNVDFETFLKLLKSKYTAIEFVYFQSNIEGELVNKILEFSVTNNAILLNAGAYTHTSIAIADAIAAIKIPVVEVHISNIFAREDYRHVSYMGAKCKGSISGFGLQSYELAVQSLLL